MKKSKPHKVIKKDNVEALYKTSCQLYNFDFPEKLKEEKYRHLLLLLSATRSTADTTKKLLDYEGEILFGSVHSAFELSEVPRTVYKFSGHIGTYELVDCTAVFVPYSSGLKILYKLPRMLNYEVLYISDRRTEVCLIPHSKLSLPYDMRQWSKELMTAYFESRLGHLPVSAVSDIKRSMGIVSLDLTKKPNLVQIRKINPAPSKPQMKVSSKGMKPKPKLSKVVPSISNAEEPPEAPAAPRWGVASEFKPTHGYSPVPAEYKKSKFIKTHSLEVAPAVVGAGGYMVSIQGSPIKYSGINNAIQSMKVAAQVKKGMSYWGNPGPLNDEFVENTLMDSYEEVLDSDVPAVDDVPVMYVNKIVIEE